MWLNLISIFLLATSPINHQKKQQDTEFSTVQINRLLYLLSDERVLGDLEPTDEQKTAMKKIAKARSNAKRKLYKEVNSPQERNPLLAKMEKEYFNSFFYETLLPHQRDRILQLSSKVELNRYKGSLALYLPKKLDKQLELTVKQKSKMEEIRASKQELLMKEAKRFNERVTSIMEGENQQVLALLNEKQKIEVREIFGDEFRGRGLGDLSEIIINEYLSNRDTRKEAASKQ